ncbi:MAG TPA: DUF2807 domain-containing protein [Rhizomicrobium sp.]
MRNILFCSAAMAALLLAAGGASAATVVPLAPFKGVGLHGGGDVVLKHGDVQRVTLLKGSTQYTSFTVKDGSLEIDACNDSCPHEYDLQIEIVSPEIDAVAVHGGGDITAQGSFPALTHLAAAVHGGGDLDLRAISATNVAAAVHGGGDIKTTATGSLAAAVNGGGDITYWGNPAVSQAVNGGGDIQHATQ